MGLLSFIIGKTPEEMEAVADQYAREGEYGAAKIEYEKALDRAERKCPEKPHLIQRLTEKISTTKEALARQHFDNASDLAASDNLAEAEDLLRLALELTENEQLKHDIQSLIASISNHNRKVISKSHHHPDETRDATPLAESGDDDDGEDDEDDDEL